MNDNKFDYCEFENMGVQEILKLPKDAQEFWKNMQREKKLMKDLMLAASVITKATEEMAKVYDGYTVGTCSLLDSSLKLLQYEQMKDIQDSLESLDLNVSVDNYIDTHGGEPC